MFFKQQQYQIDFIINMKNTISLHQVAKQKAIKYHKFQTQTNKQPFSNWKALKENSGQNMISQKLSGSKQKSNQDNSLFNKFISLQRSKQKQKQRRNMYEQNNNGKGLKQFSKSSKETINKKINHQKQLQIQKINRIGKLSNPGSRSISRIYQQNSKLNQLGFSTLMDIQLSQIRQSNANFIQKNQISKSKNIQLLNEQLRQQVQQMRNKLQRIQQNLPAVPDYKPYHPYLPNENQIKQINNANQSKTVIKNPFSTKQQLNKNKFYQQLKSLIVLDKISKLANKIKGVYIKKICKQIEMYDNLNLLLRRSNRKLLKIYFRNWTQYIKNEGQRQILLKTIKQRIINKRRDRQLAKDMQNILNNQTQYSKIQQDQINNEF